MAPPFPFLATEHRLPPTTFSVKRRQQKHTARVVEPLFMMPEENCNEKMTRPQSYQLQTIESGDTFDLDSVESASHLHPASSLDERLTWRGDPVATHSDWSIIVVTNELQTNTYHVHKSILCFGPRQSRYFARIMLEQDSAKKKPKHRRKHSDLLPSMKVELDQRDANNFPILLDFIYAAALGRNASQDTVLTAASTVTSLSLHLADTDDTERSLPQEEAVITTKNVISLRYLAKKFEVDAFLMAVNKFIQRDLNITTGPAYLAQGWEYRDEQIINSARNLCAENFEQLDVKALIKLPFSLFRVIVKALESFDAENKELSIFLSDVVCRYFEKNETALSAAVLVELTDPLLMPYLSSEAAIGFTTLVKSLDVDEASEHWNELATLCHLCAQTVVREYGWGDFSVKGAVDEYLGNHRIGEHDSRIDSLLFATSFAAALEQAQQDYHGMLREQRNLEQTLNGLSESLSLMETTNKRKDEVLTKQDQLIGQAKQQIKSLKEQVQQLQEQVARQRDEKFRQPLAYADAKGPFSPIPEFIQSMSPPPPPPVGRATRSRVHAVLSDLEALNPGTTVSGGDSSHNAMSTDDIFRDLVSPSHVQSSRAGKPRQRNLLTREEMRQKSLLS